MSDMSIVERLRQWRDSIVYVLPDELRETLATAVVHIGAADAKIAELEAALRDCDEFFELNMDKLFGPGHDIAMAAGASLAISTIQRALSPQAEKKG